MSLGYGDVTLGWGTHVWLEDAVVEAEQRDAAAVTSHWGGVLT